MIELSISMPLYNAKHIAWLAMESLCRQKNIDFEWEIVCIEESKPNPFTKANIFSYLDRLKKVNCNRIKYIKLDRKISLSSKIKMIASNTSSSSKICILHAADCFSQPYRLSESFDLIVKKDFDWISTQIGPFYLIQSGETFLHDRRNNPTIVGLNMAIKTNLMRNLPLIDKHSGIDGWMVSSVKSSLNGNLNYCYNESGNWKYGFDTHGLNNISHSRIRVIRTRKDLFPSTFKLHKYIDKDILLKLSKCKKFVKVRK